LTVFVPHGSFSGMALGGQLIVHGGGGPAIPPSSFTLMSFAESWANAFELASRIVKDAMTLITRKQFWRCMKEAPP
jgi:hypothetical protein